MADEHVAARAGEARCEDERRRWSLDGRGGHSRVRVVTSRNGLSTLKAAPHQVAGHLFERGKAGSFIDDVGHFYKPLQPGPRGEREESFYAYLTSKKRADQMEIRLNECENHGYSWVLQLQRLLGEETSFSEAVRESLSALGCDLSGMRDLVGGSNSSSYLSRDSTGMVNVEGQYPGDPIAPSTMFSIQRFPTFSRAASELYEAKSAAASPMNILQNDEFGLVDESGRWLSGDEIVWSDDEVTVPSASVKVDLMALPFTLRNAPLLKVVPKFYGVVTCPDGGMLMELEDVARMYDRPAVMDVKIGLRTWYEDAAPGYIAKCMEKDASTTQSTLGFKICGMQVYRNSLQGFWRASKQWCKTLTEASVDNALQSFVHNESGLRPVDVYGGPNGVIRQLEQIEEWVQLQNEFSFFSSSILVMYEGLSGRRDGSDVQHLPNVSVRLVDFAHTFVHGYREKDDRPVDAPRQRDENFLKGLRGFRRRLVSICSR